MTSNTWNDMNSDDIQEIDKHHKGLNSILNEFHEAIQDGADNASVTWDDMFSDNIQEIYRQHKGLMSILNELHEAIQEGQKKDVLKKIFTSLLDYTTENYSTGERGMITSDYPDCSKHKKEHDNVTRHRFTLKEDFDRGKTELSIQDSAFIID